MVKTLYLIPLWEIAAGLQMLEAKLNVRQTYWSGKIYGFHGDFRAILNLKLIKELNMIYMLKKPWGQHMHDH